MRVVMVLVSLVAFVSDVSAVEFTVNTREALVGQHHAFGIEVSSRLQGKATVVVEIHVDGKQIIARIDYARHTVRISSRGLDSGAPIALTAQDLDRVQRLQTSLALGGSRVAEALVSTLTWLADYPPDVEVALETDTPEASPRQAWTSICDLIGQSITGHYTAGGETVTVQAVVGPCGVDDANECLGRCGSACQPNPGDPAAVQRFTQECFNHDLCTRATGQILSPCREEFVAASPGYFVATDCAAITGDWTVTTTGTTCFNGQCEPIPGELPTVFHFTSQSLTFTGVSDPDAIDGQVSQFTGTRSDLDQISGSWQFPTYMDQCGDAFLGYAQGSFTGQNACGQGLTMTLTGSWPWYSVQQCTPIGIGTVEGTTTATKGAPSVQVNDAVTDRLPTGLAIAPGRLRP